jgi:hypothetical protein
MNEPYNLISPCNMNLDKKKKNILFYFLKKERKSYSHVSIPHWFFCFPKACYIFHCWLQNSLSINQLLPTISITEDNNWLQSQSVLVWLSVKARVQSISPSMFQSNFSIALNQSSFFFTMCFPDG